MPRVCIVVCTSDLIILRKVYSGRYLTHGDLILDDTYLLPSRGSNYFGRHNPDLTSLPAGDGPYQMQWFELTRNRLEITRMKY